MNAGKTRKALEIQTFQPVSKLAGHAISSVDNGLEDINTRFFYIRALRRDILYRHTLSGVRFVMAL